MSKRARRVYSDEYKTEAIELVRNSGKTAAQIARDLELTQSTLATWVREAGTAPMKKNGVLEPNERVELVELRSEVRVLRMERDFLKNGRAPRRRTWSTRNSCRATAGPPGGVAVNFLVFCEPVKKHGPGAACGLDSGDVARRSRLGN